ncbi:carboxypeptidase regulatory-like domain-containing protein [Aureibacter tunicatorum]|uniref:TonB-dependent receptor n=1 Tax=Aureibacter tunicatorum TaxID=866807 RepID=A0AAE3XT55_9BACT|nr:carboxypeptidase regulatory-like domain-containing protein [Aureibacter tunicatorum]MDR6241544.1 hypothetical protein [Aureibacter tunicatorum]BDD07232.1 TonB-dependent receptor [Aureibacter tunicatorum]
MRLKLLLFSLALALNSIVVFAQSDYSVRGKVIDLKSKNAIADAKVSIKAKKQGTMTNGDGEFYFKGLREGSYSLSIESDQYDNVEMNFIYSGEPIDLGEIYLQIKHKDTDYMPVIYLDETEDESGASTQNIAGMLSSSRDVFVSKASYQLGSTGRFRVRGYDSDMTQMTLNGVTMNDQETGRIFWSNWGGLNDVMRNTDINTGISRSEYSFGGVGGSTDIDVRAASQRKQVRASYALSNRSYRNRFMLTASTGLMENGWAFSGSFSRRWTESGYIEGTPYDAWSYYLAAQKVFNEKHSLNLTVFGAPQRRGKSTASIQPVYDGVGDNYYNPYWGYQNGEVRSSRVSDYHQPVALLTHDWNISDNTKLITSAGYKFGRGGQERLNWYNTQDPRPDYYRNIEPYNRYYDTYYNPGSPDYMNPAMEGEVNQAWSEWSSDPTKSQINWDRMYAVNASSDEEGGKRAKYIMEGQYSDIQQYNFNSLLKSNISDNVELTGGLEYRHYTSRIHKRVEDLLGADYWVDIDQFAEREFGKGSDQSQSDLRNPNRKVKEGDVFGYDYDANIRHYGTFLQASVTGNKVDYYIGAQFSYTQQWRKGNMQNGMFPENSYGDSEKLNFMNYGIKGGATYKVDGRHMFHANAAFITRPPSFRNSYISPRTRNTSVDDVAELNSEKIYSSDVSYTYRSSMVDFRLTGYYTYMEDKTKLMNFFWDDENSFVNFIETGIDQKNYGLEMGLDVKLSPSFSVSSALAMGKNMYADNFTVQAYQDNNEQRVIDPQEVYSKNFRASGSPQTAMNIGVRYNSSNYWWVGLDANYFDHIYMDFNPVLRNEDTFNNTDVFSDGNLSWTPERLDGQFTMDFSAGKSWKIDEVYLRLNLSVSNLLDNTDFRTGGYEQLRFDRSEPSKFPSKYYYAYGRTYFLNVSVSF